MRPPYATVTDAAALARPSPALTALVSWPIVRGRLRVAHIFARPGSETCSRAPRALVACAAGLSALLAAGCGAARQDAHEASRTFAVEVVHHSFPAKQSIARPTQLKLQVRNSGSRTLPNVAITLDSLEYASTYKELADDKRPTWAIERGPGPVPHPPVPTQEVSQLGGAQSAYLNTWALGPLAPGRTQTFLWRLMPVKPGHYVVAYTVNAGLAGKAKAQLASGGAPQGRFTVDIASAPAINHVNPNTGKVAPGTYPIGGY